jgi:hypothetical protein
MYYCFE